MHAIRSRARHIAWSGDDPPPYSMLNPFHRVAPRYPPNDEEQGQIMRNGRNHSDSCLNNSLSVSTHHKEIGATSQNPEFLGLTHSSTAPPTSPGTDNPPSPRFPKAAPPFAAESSPSHQTTVTDSQTKETKSLKRRFRLPFKKQDTTDTAQVEKTKSNRSKRQKFTFWGQIKAIFGQWINILLICSPVGIALHFTNVNSTVVFVINFLAIMPLAGLLSYSTEEIAMRVGETLGGLLNASFGNAVELIVSIIALTKNEIIIVQTSLIGSILSNLLLVLGMCFFFGGINRTEQFFNLTVAQLASSLLSLSVGALIIPTVFHRFGTSSSPHYRETQIPALSRGTAVILLFIYACYLFFQLKTHQELYNAPSQKAPKLKSSKDKTGEMKKGLVAIGAGSAVAPASNLASGMANDAVHHETENIKEDEEGEQPQISVIAAILTLCISTAFIGINSEFMVDGIGDLVESAGISPEFVGLILIPIVGNAAEHATAVTVAVKDKMDLAIGVAVGSSMQIALLILPLVVVIGWILGNDDMTLEFDGFLVALLFISVLLVNYLIGDGRSHWLEGVLLMSMYVIIAVAAWFYPASAKSLIG